jgi:large subunit ribosomal protein L3
MKFILGKKQHMMQCFLEDGTAVPATVISAGPLVVTQVKSPDVDGYTAVQVAFDGQKTMFLHHKHKKKVEKKKAVLTSISENFEILKILKKETK